MRYSGSTAGELAVLRIPTTDSLHSEASVDLWGKALAADLSVSQSFTSSLVVGQNRIINIYIANGGTVSFSGVVGVKDKLPAGLRFISGTNGWNCSVTGQDVNCSKSVSLAPNNATSLQLTVAVMAEAAPFCINTVTVSNSSDANPDNDVDVITTTVTQGSATSYGSNLLKAAGSFTGIALYNAGTATAAISVAALDATGAVLQSSGMTNPATFALKPGEQFPVMDDQLWGFPPGEKSKLSWFRVESVIQRIFGFALAFDGALHVLDGATLSRFPAGTVILPDIVLQDFTRIHVVNPNATSIDVTIDLVAGDGKPRATATRKLAPNASMLETIPELFGSTSAAASDYFRIAADGSFIAMESMGVTGQWITALGAQDAAGGAQVLYASQYATGGPDWSTSISIVNLDPTPAQIRARLMDNDGKQIGQTLLIPIKANGKTILSGPSLFLDAGNALTQGYVEITSDGARLAGSVTFGDRQGTYSAALPLQAAANRELVFGHAASNATWYTGMAVVNPNGSDITATFQLLDKTGQLLETKTEVFKAGQRKIKLLHQFFSTIVGADVTSGYIRVSADNLITGFALFGTNYGSVLSAIPPHAIR